MEKPVAKKKAVWGKAAGSTPAKVCDKANEYLGKGPRGRILPGISLELNIEYIRECIGETQAHLSSQVRVLTYLRKIQKARKERKANG